MKVTASKTSKDSPADSAEARFNKAWQRVVNQRKKNHELHQQVTHFAEATKAQINTSEEDYASTLYIMCEKLLGFYQRKSLTLWQRETLMAWFVERYQFLCSSPFTNHLSIENLQAQFEETYQKMHPEVVELFERIEAEELGFEEDFDDELDGEDAIDDMFESFFSDFTNNQNNDSQQESGFFDDFFHQQHAETEKQQHEEKELDKLMKTGALNKLFRKLLRQLHPDLEQDKERQKVKNQLVSQLTDARDNGDIGTIFTMYAEHIGESPLLALGDVDLDNATKVLQRQFKQLRDQKDDVFAEVDPIAASLYHRFHRKTVKASQKAINEHIKELQQDTQSLKHFNVHVTSLVKLKPYLEAKYESHFYDSF